MLFDRVYRLLVGPKDQPRGLEITQLRITFDIMKTAKKNPNRSKIEIFNLTKGTRAKMEAPNQRCLLYAGYAEQDGPLLIFQGDITLATSTVENPDVKTTLDLGDGVREIRDSMISVGYAEGVTSETVIDDLSKSMGMTLNIPDDVKHKVWNHGISYYGSSMDLLDKITSSSNMEWSIQNGNLQVIERGGVTTRQGILISATSGMIGSPVRVRQAKVQKAGDKPEIVDAKEVDNGWRVKTMLMPTINPGDRVIVESLVVEGIFRVQEIKHRGDTHGNEWVSELTVVDPNKPLTKEGTSSGKGKKKDGGTVGVLPPELVR